MECRFLLRVVEVSVWGAAKGGEWWQEQVGSESFSECLFSWRFGVRLDLAHLLVCTKGWGSERDGYVRMGEPALRARGLYVDRHAGSSLGCHAYMAGLLGVCLALLLAGRSTGKAGAAACLLSGCLRQSMQRENKRNKHAAQHNLSVSCNRNIHPLFQEHPSLVFELCFCSVLRAVTGQTATEEEIDKMIETGESETIFQKAILEQGRGYVSALWGPGRRVLLL